MPEPMGAIMPIRQRIQADLADLKRDHAGRRAATSTNSEMLEAIQKYFVYKLGMTTENEADIELIQEQIKTMEAPLSAFQART
jgi:hypothetical protein